MNKKSLKEYRIWKGMKSRCYSPSQTRGYYKAENITVCDRWLHSFENFMEDMGPFPGDDYSIERIDIHDDYRPGNCKWMLQSKQSQNRRNTIWVIVDGKRMCLKEAARYMGVNYSTIYQYYSRGKLNTVIDSAEYLKHHKKEGTT